jgi:hypothetical protein
MRHNYLLTLFFLFAHVPQAFSGVLDLNYLNPNDLAGVLPQNVVNETIKLFGVYTAHRPYTGATSISHSNTLDILVEASLVKIGSGLINALNQDGIPQTPPAIPAFPMAKVSLRKGFGNGADVGISGLFYRGQMIVGGDLKIVLHDAEEGPSFALLLGYTYAQVPYAYIKDCSTISPEIRMSQRLYFAEPYIGLGGRYISGTVSVPFSLTSPVNENFTIEKSGSGGTAYAFTGVFFRIFGAQGLRLGIEGTFDISGYSTIGGVFGLGF